VRFRYPLLDGLLTPYVIAGVGAGQNQFKDRKPAGAGLSIHADDWSFMGTIGAGLEYFIANNIAFGVEARYLFSRDHQIEIDSRKQRANLDSLLLEGSLRLLFPESDTVAGAEPRDLNTEGRVYLGFRYGGSVTVHSGIGDGLEARSSNDAIGGKLDQLIGVNLGIDLTQLVGIELTGGGYSTNLAVRGVGNVAENAMYYVVPQLRVRYPLLGGRLVPYGLTGVGANFFEVKDVKPHGFTVRPSGKDISVVGLFGGGVDYFVARNIGLGLEIEYLVSRGNSIRVESKTHHVNLDAVLMSAGVRVYFGKGTGRE
jgi:opacity protein-like surface antigen